MKEFINKDDQYKKWTRITLSVIIISILAVMALTICIDPFFHYHAPLDILSYPINNEQYQNDGITRNFTYNGIITGSSMTENFMKSEADELFDADFIKVAFSGGSYRVVNDNLKRAYDSRKDVKYVIRCLDYDFLVVDKDYTGSYSEWSYLYNDNMFDDLPYLLNKSIFFRYTGNVVLNTIQGNKTTSFDEYANWSSKMEYGADILLNMYPYREPSKQNRELTEQEIEILLENVRSNVTDLADEHPETKFYYYFPPYSIIRKQQRYLTGSIDWEIEAERIAIEEILKHPNIYLFAFDDDFEVVCNLDNYHDQNHHGEWLNSYVLKCMGDNQHLLTSENYEDYIETIREFYNSYDYEALYK